VKTSTLVSAIVILALLACSGEEDTSEAKPTGGTLVVSVSGDPASLLPPLADDTQGQLISDLVYDRLAEIGDSLNTVGDSGFQPRLAKTWTWSPDSLSIAFHIDPAARWHDGKPVTARDVAFTYHVYADSVNGSAFAASLSNVDSVTATDTVTAVVWFHARSPMQFYEAVNTMQILPEHAIGNIRGPALRAAPITRAPVGSGRFRFAKWNAGQSVVLVADTVNYRGRPTLDRVIMTIAPDFNGAMTRLLGGEADMIETIPAAALPDVAKDTALAVTLSPGLDYNFVQFNLRRPLFKERELRRALTMALDRASIVRNAYDSLASVAVGPTVRAYPTTDTASLEQLPFAAAQAAHILDSLGWKDTDGEGIRDRNKSKLEFSLLVPGSSKARSAMSVLIQEQLRKIGVKMNIDNADFAGFTARQGKRDFDALFGGWHVEPSPGGIRQTWGSAGARPGGSNAGSYENPAFDAEVDSALAAMTLEERRDRFTRAYQIIIDDAPAIWLAEPKRIIAVQRRIRTTGLRADAWWANIPAWSIPANERIARDRTAPQK
jgi:peptide/nickel transport system substrate-binding protein